MDEGLILRLLAIHLLYFFYALILTMSDLLALRQKVVQGKEWRKTIDVSVGGEDFEINIRQLCDEEFWAVYENIDIDELKEFAEESDNTEEEIERIEELQDKDDLSEEEEQELETLTRSIGSSQSQIIDHIGDEAFDALQEAGKYAIMPDGDDVDEVMQKPMKEQEDEFGHVLKSPEQAQEALKNNFESMLEESIDLLAFQIGINAFFETLDDQGN